MSATDMPDWVNQLAWPESGLLPAITQDAETGQVLMLAWMSRESLLLTLERGEAVYQSRSRGIWHKGEESGHFQKLKSLRTDCDRDAILLQVEQLGGIACHTGRPHCFFRLLKDGSWQED